MSIKITNKTKNIIEQESKALGSEINYQLKQARLKALESSKTRRDLFRRIWFVPVTAVATLAVYFMLPLLDIDNPGQSIQTEIYVDVNDMEIIEQLELVENLEFYEWLSQEENMSSI